MSDVFQQQATNTTNTLSITNSVSTALSSSGVDKRFHTRNSSPGIETTFWTSVSPHVDQRSFNSCTKNHNRNKSGNSARYCRAAEDPIEHNNRHNRNDEKFGLVGDLSIYCARDTIDTINLITMVDKSDVPVYSEVHSLISFRELLDHLLSHVVPIHLNTLSDSELSAHSSDIRFIKGVLLWKPSMPTTRTFDPDTTSAFEENAAVLSPSITAGHNDNIAGHFEEVRSIDPLLQQLSSSMYRRSTSPIESHIPLKPIILLVKTGTVLRVPAVPHYRATSYTEIPVTHLIDDTSYSEIRGSTDHLRHHKITIDINRKCPTKNSGEINSCELKEAHQNFTSTNIRHSSPGAMNQHPQQHHPLSYSPFKLKHQSLITNVPYNQQHRNEKELSLQDVNQYHGTKVNVIPSRPYNHNSLPRSSPTTMGISNSNSCTSANYLSESLNSRDDKCHSMKKSIKFVPIRPMVDIIDRDALVNYLRHVTPTSYRYTKGLPCIAPEVPMKWARDGEIRSPSALELVGAFRILQTPTDASRHDDHDGMMGDYISDQDTHISHTLSYHLGRGIPEEFQFHNSAHGHCPFPPFYSESHQRNNTAHDGSDWAVTWNGTTPRMMFLAPHTLLSRIFNTSTAIGDDEVGDNLDTTLISYQYKSGQHATSKIRNGEHDVSFEVNGQIAEDRLCRVISRLMCGINNEHDFSNDVDRCNKDDVNSNSSVLQSHAAFDVAHDHVVVSSNVVSVEPTHLVLSWSQLLLRFRHEIDSISHRPEDKMKKAKKQVNLRFPLRVSPGKSDDASYEFSLQALNMLLLAPSYKRGTVDHNGLIPPELVFSAQQLLESHVHKESKIESSKVDNDKGHNEESTYVNKNRQCGGGGYPYGHSVLLRLAATVRKAIYTSQASSAVTSDTSNHRTPSTTIVSNCNKYTNSRVYGNPPTVHAHPSIIGTPDLYANEMQRYSALLLCEVRLPKNTMVDNNKGLRQGNKCELAGNLEGHLNSTNCHRQRPREALEIELMTTVTGGFHEGHLLGSHYFEEEKVSSTGRELETISYQTSEEGDAGDCVDDQCIIVTDHSQQRLFIPTTAFSSKRTAKMYKKCCPLPGNTAGPQSMVVVTSPSAHHIVLPKYVLLCNHRLNYQQLIDEMFLIMNSSATIVCNALNELVLWSSEGFIMCKQHPSNRIISWCRCCHVGCCKSCMQRDHPSPFSSSVQTNRIGRSVGKDTEGNDSLAAYLSMELSLEHELAIKGVNAITERVASYSSQDAAQFGLDLFMVGGKCVKETSDDAARQESLQQEDKMNRNRELLLWGLADDELTLNRLRRGERQHYHKSLSRVLPPSVPSTSPLNCGISTAVGQRPFDRNQHRLHIGSTLEDSYYKTLDGILLYANTSRIEILWSVHQELNIGEKFTGSKFFYDDGCTQTYVRDSKDLDTFEGGTKFSPRKDQYSSMFREWKARKSPMKWNCINEPYVLCFPLDQLDSPEDRAIGEFKHLPKVLRSLLVRNSIMFLAVERVLDLKRLQGRVRDKIKAKNVEFREMVKMEGKSKENGIFGGIEGGRSTDGSSSLSQFGQVETSINKSHAQMRAYSTWGDRYRKQQTEIFKGLVKIERLIVGLCETIELIHVLAVESVLSWALSTHSDFILLKTQNNRNDKDVNTTDCNSAQYGLLCKKLHRFVKLTFMSSITHLHNLLEESNDGMEEVYSLLGSKYKSLHSENERDTSNGMSSQKHQEHTVKTLQRDDDTSHPLESPNLLTPATEHPPLCHFFWVISNFISRVRALSPFSMQPSSKGMIRKERALFSEPFVLSGEKWYLKLLVSRVMAKQQQSRDPTVPLSSQVTHSVCNGERKPQEVVSVFLCPFGHMKRLKFSIMIQNCSHSPLQISKSDIVKSTTKGMNQGQENNMGTRNHIRTTWVKMQTKLWPTSYAGKGWGIHPLMSLDYTARHHVDPSSGTLKIGIIPVGTTL